MGDAYMIFTCFFLDEQMKMRIICKLQLKSMRIFSELQLVSSKSSHTVGKLWDLMSVYYICTKDTANNHVVGSLLLSKHMLGDPVNSLF